MKTLLNLFLIAYLVLMVSGRAPVEDGYSVGDRVDNFTLKNVDGRMVSLADYKGKGVILIFDCNTCPYSRAYNDRIIELHDKYSPKGFPVITINTNDPDMSPGDSFDEMARRAKRKNYTFPYLVDESQEVGHAFGATNTPHVFLLRRTGNVFTVAYIGAIDNNSRDASKADRKYVEEAIAAVLSGKEVTTKQTKAIGCTIKYRNI